MYVYLSQCKFTNTLRICKAFGLFISKINAPLLPKESLCHRERKAYIAGASMCPPDDVYLLCTKCVQFCVQFFDVTFMMFCGLRHQMCTIAFWGVFCSRIKIYALWKVSLISKHQASAFLSFIRSEQAMLTAITLTINTSDNTVSICIYSCTSNLTPINTKSKHTPIFDDDENENP